MQYNAIQYKHEYYDSGLNPVEFRSHQTHCFECAFELRAKNHSKNVLIKGIRLSHTSPKLSIALSTVSTHKFSRITPVLTSSHWLLILWNSLFQ